MTVTARRPHDPLCPSRSELDRLLEGRLHDPHRVLGSHPLPGEETMSVVRAWHPGAVGAELLRAGAEPLAMRRIHPDGLFAKDAR